MRKAIALLLVAIITLSLLSSCNRFSSAENTENISKESTESAPDVTAEHSTAEQDILNDKYSSQPFFDKENTTGDLSNDQIKQIISVVPCDKYEEYPFLHNEPLTATLYKNGEVISIDVKDPRLIGLVNLFNNSVHHNHCAYTQSWLPIKSLEENVLHEDFRLELTYTPYRTSQPDGLPYPITTCDTIIVTDGDFVTIAHDEDFFGTYDPENHPYKAVGYTPFYFLNANWLELFGF